MSIWEIIQLKRAGKTVIKLTLNSGLKASSLGRIPNDCSAFSERYRNRNVIKGLFRSSSKYQPRELGFGLDGGTMTARAGPNCTPYEISCPLSFFSGTLVRDGTDTLGLAAAVFLAFAGFVGFTGVSGIAGLSGESVPR